MWELVMFGDKGEGEQATNRPQKIEHLQIVSWKLGL